MLIKYDLRYEKKHNGSVFCYCEPTDTSVDQRTISNWLNDMSCAVLNNGTSMGAGVYADTSMPNI